MGSVEEIVPIIEMRNITKTFFGVPANHNVCLKVFPQEIHALLGENGAGKSTLMNILTGIYCPDEGDIIFKGEKLNRHSPRVASRLGIGMVHQHFKLVNTLTVAENLYLFVERCGFILNRKVMREHVEQIAAKYKLEVDPKAKIWQLSIGEQQRVEILKMLITGAELLILDEPTSVLSPIEVEELFISLRHMVADGKSVLFITHKMDEVMRFSDRITVLRDGCQMASLMTADASRSEILKLVLKRECHRTTKKAEGKISDNVVLRVEGLSVMNDRGIQILDDVSLTLKKGEVLGIAGVAGSGQREMVEAISGLRKVVSGSIHVGDVEVSRLDPRKTIDAGVSYIPEDRLGTGLVAQMSAYENSMLRDYCNAPVVQRGILNHAKIKERTANFIAVRNIKCHDAKLPVALMSGGNLQKLLVAREINAKPKLLLAAYPTHGLDFGAVLDIHDMLVEERNRGVSILLISEDLDELFELSDRIAVMHAGRLMGVFITDEVECGLVGQLMLGDTDILRGGGS